MDTAVVFEPTVYDVEKPPPAGQELGPAVRSLLTRGVERGQSGGLAAGGGDSIESTARMGREDDDPVAVPRPSTPLPSFTERLRRTARNFDPLELALSEEPERAAVRRPEGELGALGTAERLGSE